MRRLVGGAAMNAATSDGRSKKGKSCFSGTGMNITGERERRRAGASVEDVDGCTDVSARSRTSWGVKDTGRICTALDADPDRPRTSRRERGGLDGCCEKVVDANESRGDPRGDLVGAETSVA